MRILVTGSRHWSDELAVMIILLSLPASRDYTLVHGAAPGLDTIAASAAAALGWKVEAFPADWSLGRSAGPRRNQEMVDAGADLCLAFPFDDSRGTIHCMGAAREEGMPVRVFRPPTCDLITMVFSQLGGVEGLFDRESSHAIARKTLRHVKFLNPSAIDPWA